VFEKDYFASLWSDLMQNEKLVIKTQLSVQPLLQECTDLTLMTLVFDMVESRTFRKGELIVSMAKQAPTNIYFRPYFETRISKLASDIKKKKGKIEESRSASRVIVEEINSGDESSAPKQMY